MKEKDKDELQALSRDVQSINSEMEFHPSIRELVKILARKAAEEHYAELLRVMRGKYGEDVDK